MPDRYNRFARFEPKRRDDLRPEIVQYIGATLHWTYAGGALPGEPYPGQDRWMPSEAAKYEYLTWVPDEDLIDVSES